jgi:signal transduction histidine kinase
VCAKIAAVTEDLRPPAARVGGGDANRGPGDTFWSTPWPLRAWVAACVVAAVVLPLSLNSLGPARPAHTIWATVLLLVALSALNIEIGRAFTKGLHHAPQPDTALTAWIFSSALLLPPPWLLVVVPVTFAHARWRGIRGAGWRWVRTGAILVLAGVAAAVVRHLIVPDQPNWMDGNGGRGMVTMLAAAAAFLVVDCGLLLVAWLLSRADNEPWLRTRLTSLSFYGTEGAVLLIGGLLSAVWTGGAWYVPLFVPIYVFAQRAALHEPLRARAEAAAALAAKNDALERANQFKVDLLGVLGHEIANPLTAIAGHAEIGVEALENDEDVATARLSLEVVERNAAQIKGVLHEVLAIVSSEGGVLTARREECPIGSHVAEAIAAQPGDRRPRVHGEPGLVALVQPNHLDQILANLLSNAEKYGGGATEIRAWSTGTGAVHVAVSDAGPGIAPEFRSQLFQRFSRDLGTAGRVAGTGLGLFISRELARANGGDLHHEDVLPTGSRFVLTLTTPAAPGA